MKNYNRKFLTLDQKRAFSNWKDVFFESTELDKANKRNVEKARWVSIMNTVTENVDTRMKGGNIFETYGSQAPEQMPGVGPVAWPSDPGTGVGAEDGAWFRSGYVDGSGDVPNAKIGMAMQIAAETIGLELLPVIPMELPSMMFAYLDHLYADGAIDRSAEPPTFFQISGGNIATANFDYSNFTKGDVVFLTQADINDAGTADAYVAATPAIKAIYYGTHRFTGAVILQFTSTGVIAANRGYTAGTTNSISDITNSSLASGASNWVLAKGAGDTINALTGSPLKFTDGADIGVAAPVPSLINSLDEHIPEYSNTVAQTTSAGPDRFSATRDQGEDGTTRAISLKTFTRSIEAGTVEVIGNLTKTQLKDLAMYGVDPLEEIYRACQNELTQTINRDILRTMFRLGVTAHAQLKYAQGVDLNLFAGPATDTEADLSEFGLSEFVDIVGSDRTADFTGVKNTETNSSAENQYSRARRLYSRILAAKNIIATIGRHGTGNFAVVNTQISSALQDVKNFTQVMADNDIEVQNRNLYYIGMLQGVMVYCDPLMDYNDNRVLVGRKGMENEPGLKFFVYQLADSIETISETSMAPKISVTSRYNLAPTGFFPEAQYLTFGAYSSFGSWV